MTDKLKSVELFTEILGSDKLIQGFHWNNWVVRNLGDNPSVIWDRLAWDPWTAMAVYTDMEEKDSTLFSCLQKRRDGVISLQRYVKAASESPEDKKIAEFIEETIEQYWGGNSEGFDTTPPATPFELFLDEALEAVGDGMNLGEIIFENASDRVFIKDVKFKPQNLFAFGDTNVAGYSTASMMFPQNGPLCLRMGVTMDDYGMGRPLPEWKFFTFSYRTRKGNRWGMPLKKYCFWQTWVKRNGVRAWLRYIEKGSGTVIARYNDGAAKGEMEMANAAATAVQEESAVAIPKKFILEVHEMIRNIGTSHKELVDDYCNAEISRAVVGQTLTGRGSDGGGSRALGEVHERVESKKVEFDAKQLMAVVNARIVRPLVVMNFGPNVKTPVWTLEYEPQEDLTRKAERYAILHKDVGLPLSKDQMYQELQVQPPQNEEDTLPAGIEADKAATGSEDPLTMNLAEGEKKKLVPPSANRSRSKTERFTRFRPSMIEFSDE